VLCVDNVNGLLNRSADVTGTESGGGGEKSQGGGGGGGMFCGKEVCAVRECHAATDVFIQQL